jgi:hypothetical protein
MTAREVDAVLTRAADTIEDQAYPYQFQNWNTCAVGHIAAAVQGRDPGLIDEAELLEAVSDPTAGGELMEALREIARRIPPAPYEGGTLHERGPEERISDRSLDHEGHGDKRGGVARWLRSLRATGETTA